MPRADGAQRYSRRAGDCSQGKLAHFEVRYVGGGRSKRQDTRDGDCPNTGYEDQCQDDVKQTHNGHEHSQDGNSPEPISGWP